jgi:hypothetical protein
VPRHVPHCRLYKRPLGHAERDYAWQHRGLGQGRLRHRDERARGITLGQEYIKATPRATENDRQDDPERRFDSCDKDPRPVPLFVVCYANRHIAARTSRKKEKAPNGISFEPWEGRGWHHYDHF